MKAAYGRRRQGSAKENAETALLFTADLSAPMEDSGMGAALAREGTQLRFANCKAEARNVT